MPRVAILTSEPEAGTKRPHFKNHTFLSAIALGNKPNDDFNDLSFIVNVRLYPAAQIKERAPSQLDEGARSFTAERDFAAG